jgi:hypothetical protein
VCRAGNPDRAAEFFHPVLVMFVALAAWLIVDRILPSGWGPQQAAFATLIASGSMTFVAMVYAIADRPPTVRRSEAGATDSGPARVVAPASFLPSAVWEVGVRAPSMLSMHVDKVPGHDDPAQ